MRYPVNNYKEEWDNHAGYDFGDVTSYGFHDGKDINDNGGGNSDLGKPLFAISKGTVIGIHKHTGAGNFGNHFFLKIDGEWGTRYVHYAHCLELLVQENQQVEEGDLVAKVGNSGTTYAHCHFAIKHKANGMDTIAHNKAELDDAWEDPIAFIEKYLNHATITQPIAQVITPQTRLPLLDNKEQQQVLAEFEAKNRKIADDAVTIQRAIKDAEEAIKDAKELKSRYDSLDAEFKAHLQTHNPEEVEIVTTTYPASPETPPKSEATFELPPILVSLIQYLKKWLNP